MSLILKEFFVMVFSVFVSAYLISLFYCDFLVQNPVGSHEAIREGDIMRTDYDEFLTFFDEMGETLEEKKDAIDRLWNFVSYLVDKAFDDPESFEGMAGKLEKD